MPTLRRNASGVCALFALACNGPSPSARIEDVSVELSDVISTVAFATWSSSGPAHVEYGLDEGYGLTTPETEDGQATLYGLHPEETYHFRVVAEGVESEDRTFESGQMPEGVPRFELVGSDESRRGWLALSFIDLMEPYTGVVIVDTAGVPVWSWLLGVGSDPWVELTPEGDGLLTRLDGRDMPEDSKAVRISFDGTEVEEYPTPDGHHAMAQVPGIEFAYLRSVAQEWEGETVVGDEIVEVAEDGTETVMWSAWDSLEVERHEGWNYVSSDLGDWTHANGLAYDSTEDDYLLSLYWLGTLLRIDRSTGEILWRLGGGDSDFEFEARGFGHLHAPEPRPGGVLFFDNQADGGSEARELALDEDAWVASDLWSYQRPDGREAIVLGDVDRLDDGSTVIGWGDIAEASVVDAEGNTTWHVATTPGIVIGQVEWIGSFNP